MLGEGFAGLTIVHAAIASIDFAGAAIMVEWVFWMTRSADGGPGA